MEDLFGMIDYWTANYWRIAEDLVTTSFPSNQQMLEWMLQGDFARMGRLARFIPLMIFLSLLDAVLKAFALRKAGNHKQLTRFICLLIFNTCGILPAIYLIWFQKESERVKK